MLGRTANGLFWMFRYIERAENTARLIDAGLRMSLTRMHGHEEEWESVLRSSGVFGAYCEANPEVTSADAVNYLLRDKSNPSSVLCAIEAARNNGRMVRTALTREAWEATNECYLDIKAQLARKPSKCGHAGDHRQHQAAHGIDPRRLSRHHAAQRAVQFLAHRHLYRARRQHLADSRREVLRAAAGGFLCRLVARQCAMGIDPEVGFGTPFLWLGL
jgi:hypothetical protein